jgi:Transcriptional regulator
MQVFLCTACSTVVDATYKLPPFRSIFPSLYLCYHGNTNMSNGYIVKLTGTIFCAMIKLSSNIQEDENMVDQLKTSETKKKLIANALEMFKLQGYEAVTINQICDAVSISKNTFYYHFKSKEELLVACMGIQKSLSMSELTDILLSEKSFFEQFWMLQKTRIDFVMSCGSEIMRNIQHIHTGHDIETVRIENELQKTEIAILQKAQDAGEIRSGSDIQSLVLAGSIQFLGVLALWISVDGEFDFEKVLRSCFECSFGVKPELQWGEDLKTHLSSGVEKKNSTLKNEE